MNLGIQNGRSAELACMRCVRICARLHTLCGWMRELPVSNRPNLFGGD
jgi:hypothetical protein